LRVAILSDTHMPRGARRLPDGCIELMRGADLILHAGDFSEPAVLEQIQGYGPLVAVHGNVDSPELRRELPESTAIDIEGATIAMVHDAGPAKGRLARMRARFPDADALVFGHSHMPLHESEGSEPGSFQIFNPGSPTERRRAPSRTMGMAEVADGRVRFELVELAP
jgi:putative phosphoesterase